MSDEEEDDGHPKVENIDFLPEDEHGHYGYGSIEWKEGEEPEQWLFQPHLLKKALETADHLFEPAEDDEDFVYAVISVVDDAPIMISNTREDDSGILIAPARPDDDQEQSELNDGENENE